MRASFAGPAAFVLAGLSFAACGDPPAAQPSAHAGSLPAAEPAAPPARTSYSRHAFVRLFPIADLPTRPSPWSAFRRPATGLGSEHANRQRDARRGG